MPHKRYFGLDFKVFRFALVGGSSLLIDLAVLSIFLSFCSYILSRIIASTLSLGFSYVMTCRFVFQARFGVNSFLTYFSGISVAYFLSLSVSLLIPLLFELMNQWPQVNILVGALVAALFNFKFQKRFLSK